MTFVLIALGVVILMVVAKDQAQLRKWNAAREYNDEDWCYSPFSNTEYTDGEPRGVPREVYMGD